MRRDKWKLKDISYRFRFSKFEIRNHVVNENVEIVREWGTRLITGI